MQSGKKVRLTNGTTATVKKEIGHGGQGTVYLVNVEGKENLIRVFYDEGKDSTIQKLEAFLPILSEKGSKDDMSPAGCINPKAIANGIKIIDLKHSQASLEESL